MAILRSRENRISERKKKNLYLKKLVNIVYIKRR